MKRGQLAWSSNNSNINITNLCAWLSEPRSNLGSFGYQKIVNRRMVTRIVRSRQKQKYIIIKKKN